LVLRRDVHPGLRRRFSYIIAPQPSTTTNTTTKPTLRISQNQPASLVTPLSRRYSFALIDQAAFRMFDFTDWF
jgi:hypothetical protein